MDSARRSSLAGIVKEYLNVLANIADLTPDVKLRLLDIPTTA